MKEVKNIEDFVKYNDQDLRRIIATKFRNFFRCDRTLDDLVNSYYVNAIKSDIIGKFDPSRGVKFSTYIITTIRNYLCSYLTDNTKKGIFWYKMTESLDFHVAKDGSIKNLDHILDDKIIPCNNFNYDADKILKRLFIEDTKNPKSAIKLSKLFILFYEGWRERDCARDYGVTDQAIALRKKQLRKVISNYLELE